MLAVIIDDILSILYIQSLVMPVLMTDEVPADGIL
jgi:hypothetical protein